MKPISGPQYPSHTWNRSPDPEPERSGCGPLAWLAALAVGGLAVAIVLLWVAVRVVRLAWEG